MATSVLSPVEIEAEIDYPSSDGKPVAESEVHIDALLDARGALYEYFRSHPDVYVAGNLLIYYKKGARDVRVAPDVFVVKGVSKKHKRTSYRLWEEGRVPEFVLEITSQGTRKEDEGRKRELYRAWGVTEYWQYDPLGEYLAPPLRGLELIGGEYERLPDGERADGTQVMRSAVLGLEVRSGAEGLRFRDPVTGEMLYTPSEGYAERQRAERAWQQAEQARQREKQARQAAETSLEREASARQQAEAGRQAAEARVAELEALLRRERGRD